MFPRATWIPLLLAFLAFGFAQEFLLGTSPQKARQITTLTHLKKIGLEMQVYAEAHDGKLPPLQSREALLRALPKIAPDEAESVVWKVPFATNPNAPDTLEEAQRVVVYEAGAYWGGGKYRGVLFADGHAKMADSAAWRELRAKSGIVERPEPRVARWWETGKSGPREPIPTALLGELLTYGALFWVAVGAWLRARLCPKPVAEFFVALVSYGVIFSLLATILMPFFRSVRIR